VTTATSSDDWTEPGAHRVADGVHRIPLPLPNDGLRAVNVYVLETADGLVAIDSGWALEESRALLDRALASIGAGVADIRQFLVTHVHRDHYTQAVAIRRETGVDISLGEGERPTLEFTRQEPGRAMSQQVDGLRALGADALADAVAAWVVGEGEVGLWELPDRWLRDSALPLPGGRVLEAVETPGHTAGHVVFHDLQARLLFAGDHVLPTITPSIGFEPVRVADPLGAFLGSLERVRSRPDALLLPAHGPVAPSAHARVDELIAFHGERLDELERAAAGKGVTAVEAAQQIRWTKRGHHYDSLDVFNAMLATFETAAHLDLLVSQQRLTRTVAEGVLRYR
jgi:glyoxylase-like metal-dependent hydrolase (beta-lactamase superfamily II)